MPGVPGRPSTRRAAPIGTRRRVQPTPVEECGTPCRPLGRRAGHHRRRRLFPVFRPDETAISSRRNRLFVPTRSDSRRDGAEPYDGRFEVDDPVHLMAPEPSTEGGRLLSPGA